ncbi:signal peptidase II [Sulfuritortus calidifontis]|uniref:Lipoprotein signal peptidase n=1 Tax=Sulfuritortus calidifontis TaxID=1914471 RepID=A0A4R3K146_9PROT|nr:signal peptidase II [Sulfuritortus calidifontis]TCS73996.1 signal peptidase II [Sulfuritortus calidifontis]
MNTPDIRGQKSEIRNRQSGLAWLWLAALVLVLDQMTKLAVIQTMALHDAIPVTDFFNLVRAHNTGAAFSLLADQPGWQRIFFLAIGLVASGVILHLLRKTRGRPLFCLALALILGGAVGNVIDRLAYGHVVDFLDFHLGDWHWPAFNVADSGITVGAVLLVWQSLRKQP